jgi:hypothetical protein
MQVSHYQKLTVLKVNLYRRIKRAAVLVFFLGLSLVASPARSQNSEMQTPADQSPGNKADQSTKAQLQQKQLADDTAKLFELANELKADMDKTTKDTLSLAVVKKAEQVEKLAHKVREEMKASLGN